MTAEMTIEDVERLEQALKQKFTDRTGQAFHDCHDLIGTHLPALLRIARAHIEAKGGEVELESFAHGLSEILASFDGPDSAEWDRFCEALQPRVIALVASTLAAKEAEIAEANAALVAIERAIDTYRLDKPHTYPDLLKGVALLRDAIEKGE